MNKVILTGRITKELELRFTQNNKAVVEFTNATNRPINKYGERVADFINCIVYGSQADNLSKYQGKGSLIAVFGELRVDTWKNEEGKTKYKTYVLANNVELLESKKETNKENLTVQKEETPVEETNPFKEFGEEHQEELDLDNELPF